MRSISNYCTPETPVRLSPQHRDCYGFIPEEQYLNALMQQTTKIFTTLCTEKEQFELKFNQKQHQYTIRAQEQQSLIQQLISKNGQLQSENAQIKLNLDQTLRYLKRYEMKIKLLSNRISHLSQDISEKQAIIKYLQGKNQQIHRHNSSSNISHNLTNQSIINLDELSSSFNQAELSFAKLKQNKIKFESFSNFSGKIDFKQVKQLSDPKVRSKRIRTQSSNSIKQNCGDYNTKVSSHSKLQSFLATRQWNNPHDKNADPNDKTLSKKGHMTKNSYGWLDMGMGGESVVRKSVNGNNSSYFSDYRQNESFGSGQLFGKK